MHYDMEILLDNFVLIFVAGQETTAGALSFILAETARRPGVLKRILTEVDAVVGRKSDISMEDVGNLKYLGQVFKESLRLYPLSPVTMRDSIPNQKIGGYVLPDGATILISTYANCRMEENYENPLEFNPNRFEEGKPINVYTYFPFSLGPRNCIGQTFAKIETKIILAKFFQQFEMKMDTSRDIEIEDRMTLRVKGGIPCTLTLRDSPCVEDI